MGGHVVDSPGLRQVGLWDIPIEEIAWCYPDLRPYLGSCRFADCSHGPEPGCAITAAVAAGCHQRRAPRLVPSPRREGPEPAPAAHTISGPMEIAPNLHAVPLKSAGAFLVTEDRLTLIDAGLAGSRPMLLRYLGDIDRSIDELERIVCTHGHPDHVGGVRELADGAAVEVFVHPADLEGVSLTVREALVTPSGDSLRGRLLQAVTPHPGAATPLNDGDVLPVLGGLEVIHTPGHTPGSVCLYARGPRFCSPATCSRSGAGSWPSRARSSATTTPRPAHRSERLTHLDVDMIAFSHYRADARGGLGRPG